MEKLRSALTLSLLTFSTANVANRCSALFTATAGPYSFSERPDIDNALERQTTAKVHWQQIAKLYEQVRSATYSGTPHFCKQVAAPAARPGYCNKIRQIWNDRDWRRLRLC